MAISCIVTVAMASNVPDDVAGVRGLNVIKSPLAGNGSIPRVASSPFLRITVWVPSYFNLGDGTAKRSSSAAPSSGNSTLEKKPPNSIQLWLNRTSRTEVHLGPNIHRNAVEIYGEYLKNYSR